MSSSKLFSSFRFNDTDKTMPNRIALAPLTNLQSNTDGTLSDDEFKWLQRRAKEGFGLICTCAAYVAEDSKGCLGMRENWVLLTISHLPGLTRLAAGIHAYNSLALVQIFHGGARSPQECTGTQPWSASTHTMPHPKTPVEVREATTDDINHAIANFTAAAKRAEQAGFDGVELHGAHGYLLHQFLSTATNLRSDEWGGTLQNRSRLLRTILQKIKAATSKNFLVGVRLSPEDKYTFKGIDFDESLQVAQWLAADGAAFIHLSPWDAFKKPDKYAQGDKALITYFREALPDTPLLVAGNIWSRSDAEKAIELGADIVVIGKAAIAHANWPSQVKDFSAQPAPQPYTVYSIFRNSWAPPLSGT